MSGTSYSPQRLPLGVAILAVLIGLVGVLYLLLGVLVLLTVASFGSLLPHFFGTGLVGGLIVLFIGIVLLVVARGLWDLELWALVLCILVVGGVWLSDLLVGRFLSLGAIILLLLLIYLVAVHREFT